MCKSESQNGLTFGTPSSCKKYCRWHHDRIHVCDLRIERKKYPQEAAAPPQSSAPARLDARRQPEWISISLIRCQCSWQNGRRGHSNKAQNPWDRVYRAEKRLSSCHRRVLKWDTLQQLATRAKYSLCQQFFSGHVMSEGK
jgi:hypothetical protein